jgi:hypothetical protein
MLHYYSYVNIRFPLLYSEFLDGDKRIKKISRGQAKENMRRESYTKYSRSFRKARIDSQTFRLDIETE